MPKQVDSPQSIVDKRTQLEAWLRDHPNAEPLVRQEIQARLKEINEQLNDKNDD